MSYLPWRVGKRIEYLLHNGRRIEAAALIALEWDQYELSKSALQVAFDAMMYSVSNALLPAFERMEQVFAEAAQAFTEYRDYGAK